MLVRLVVVLLLACSGVLSGIGGPGLAHAQEQQESFSQTLERWDEEARTVQRRLEFDPPQADEIAGQLEMVGNQLEAIPAVRAAIEAELKPQADQLTALGEAPEDASTEAPAIALERRRLQGEISTLDGYLKRVDQAEARALGLETGLGNLRRSRFTEQLVSRGPSVLEPSVTEAGLTAIGRTAGVVLLETQTRLQRMRMTAVTVGRIALPLLLLFGAMALLFQVKRGLLGWLLERAGEGQTLSRRVTVGIGVMLARLLLPAGALLMTLTALRVSGLFGGQGLLLLEGIERAAYVVIGAYALGGAFFAPHAPSMRLSLLDETGARRAHRWLILLAGAVGLDRALVVQGEMMGLPIEGLALLNVTVISLGSIALWRFLDILARHPAVQAETAEATPPAGAVDPPPDPDPEDDPDPRPQRPAIGLSVRVLRLVARLAAMAAPVLALLGYYAGARYAFYPLVFSGAVIGICVLLFHVVQAVVANIGGESRSDDPTVSRLQLIPFLVAFLLACGAAPVLALIWGAAPSELDVVWRRMLEGFQIGEVVISPLDFLVFLAVAVVGYLLTGRFKRLLRNRVLPLTGLDTGGRDAVAAGAGYLGLVITALIAVSATGVDLSNLAIVAGALSVGIGFGLQNIVNNFVSGIILLIERPIKAGDWIELPSGMGYVKTINVRSTEVETFDRASLFVPNSQLISENVINWTHSNLNGRIIVKVGVEYGSDPRKVERILQEIGRAHPMMLRRPAPYVLFRGFGADSLDFEIRGVLRDVNWILNTQSDINFEIARRFKEEGIGIPFRQADVELKNPKAIAEAVKTVFGGHVLPPPAPTGGDGSDGGSAGGAPAPRHRSAAGKEGDADGDTDADGNGDAR